MKIKLEVKTESGWQERSPQNGEVVRKTYISTGHQSIMKWQGEEDTEQGLIPILLRSVQGAESTNEQMTMISAPEGSVLLFSGEVAIPDKVFLTPIQKENMATGEITTLYKQIAVESGVFSFELALSAGKYRITQDLMNAELPQPVFSLEPIEIYITI